MTPPFNPVCGKALPFCSSSQNTIAENATSPAVEKVLPTLPPINDTRPQQQKNKPDQGYMLIAPLFSNPSPEGNGTAAMPKQSKFEWQNSNRGNSQNKMTRTSDIHFDTE